VSFTSVPKPTKEGATVNIETTDTIYVSKNTDIYYDIKLPVGTYLRSVKATIRDFEYDGYQLNDHFTLNPFTIGTGTYKLKVEYNWATGTGSLADKNGLETLSLWREITVIIDVDPPPTIQITIDTLNGALTLHWKPYIKWNFVSYTIYKEFAPENNYPYSNRPPVVILDSATSQWTDPDYIGGYARYRIETKAASTSYGDLKSYYWMPTATYEVVNGKAVVTLEKPKFYAPSLTMTLKEGYSDEITINQVIYTSLKKISLGLPVKYVIALNAPNPINTIRVSVNAYIGTAYHAPSVNPMFYNSTQSLYYGDAMVVMDKDLKYLSTSNTTAVGSIFKSQDNTRIITFVPTPANDKNYFYELNPLSLAPFNPFNLSTGYNKARVANGDTYTNYAYKLTLGNNGLIAFSTDKNGVMVLALPDYHQVYSRNISNKTFVISSTGNYLFDESTIYKYNGTSFETYSNAINTTNLTDAIFINDDNLVLLYKNPNNIKIINIKDLTVLQEIKISISDMHLYYDDISGKIICGTGNDFYLIDPDTGSSKYFVANYHTRLINGKLFAIDAYDQSKTFYSLDYQSL
jgi:hypothetical protein